MSTTADIHDAGHGHGHDAHGAHGDEHGHDPHLAHHFDTPEQQFSTSKLGIWLFLATEVLMFGGLFCAYSVYRYNHPQVYLFAHNALDPTWGMINTIVLLASSFTMAWGVRAAQLNQRGLLQLMLVLTFIGGVVFMCVKTVEYQQKWKYHLFPGKYNAFNASSVLTEGPKAATDKGEAIAHIQEEAEMRHGGHHGGTDEEHGAEGGAPASDTEHTGGKSGGGSPHVEDKSRRTSEHLNAGSESGRPAKLQTRSSPGNQPSRTGAAGPLIDARPHVHRRCQLTGTPDAANIRSARPSVAGGTSIRTPMSRPAITGPPMPRWSRPTSAQLNTFFSIYFMMTGLHGIHVLVGMGLIAWLFIRQGGLRCLQSASYFTPVDLGGLYWHLVDLDLDLPVPAAVPDPLIWIESISQASTGRWTNDGLTMPHDQPLTVDLKPLSENAHVTLPHPTSRC